MVGSGWGGVARKGGDEGRFLLLWFSFTSKCWEIYSYFPSPYVFLAWADFHWGRSKPNKPETPNIWELFVEANRERVQTFGEVVIWGIVQQDKRKASPENKEFLESSQAERVGSCCF